MTFEQILLQVTVYSSYPTLHSHLLHQYEATKQKFSLLFSSSWLSKHSWIIQATNVSKTSKPRYDTQQPWLLGHQLPSIHCLIQSPQLQSWYVHTALLEEVCRCDSWMTSNLTKKWTLEHSAIKRNKKKTFF